MYQRAQLPDFNRRDPVRGAGLAPIALALLSVLTASILAGASITLGSRPVPALDSSGIQRVREYYSALNQYARTGEMDILRTVLDPDTGQGSAGAEAGHEAVLPDLQLAALRASYPEITFSIVAIEPHATGVMAGIAADTGPAKLPPWLSVDADSLLSPYPVLLEIVEQRVSTSSGPEFHLPSYLGVVPQDAEFRSTTPGRLALASMTIRSNGEGAKLVPLPGPGIFFVQSGSVTVVGDGSAEVFELRTSSYHSLPAGSTFTAQAGDAVIVPIDESGVRIDRVGTATLLAALSVPIETVPDRYFEREQVDPERMGLSTVDLLREAPHGVQETWYGEIELLSITERAIFARSRHVEAGWLILPPHSDAVIDNGNAEETVLEAIGGPIVSMPIAGGRQVIANHGNSTVFVFAAQYAKADAP